MHTKSSMEFPVTEKIQGGFSQERFARKDEKVTRIDFLIFFWKTLQSKLLFIKSIFLKKNTFLQNLDYHCNKRENILNTYSLRWYNLSFLRIARKFDLFFCFILFGSHEKKTYLPQT